MNWIIVVLGLVMIVTGIVGIADPVRLFSYANWWKEPSRIYVAAVLRLGLGAVLWYAAPQTDYSTVVRVLGAVMFVSGVGFFIAGAERVMAMIDWWMDLSPAIHRVWLLFAVALGILLIAAAW